MTTPRNNLFRTRALAALLALAPVASAGGTPYTTVQPGDWDDPAVWDLGAVPGGSPGDQADVLHAVTVDSTVPFVNSVGAMSSGADALRLVDGGTLLTNGAFVAGELLQTGGTLDVASDFIVSDTDDCLYALSGGQLGADWVRVGASGLGPGTFQVDGGAATATVDRFDLDLHAVLHLRPAAAGSSGLTTIVTNQLEIDDAALFVEPSYPAFVGDSWDFATYNTLTGTGFSTVVTSFGYAMALDTSTPGVLRVTVTASPFGPLGDTCANAIPLTLEDDVLGSYAGATVSGPATTCQLASLGADRWFSYTHMDTEATVVSAVLGAVGDDAVLTDVSIELWDACGGTVLACDGLGATPAQTTGVSWVAQPGITYLLRTAATDPDAGDWGVIVFRDGGWFVFPSGSPGVNGVPGVAGTGHILEGETFGVELFDAPPNAPVLAWLALGDPPPFPALGGTVNAFPFVNQFLFATDASGELSVSSTWPAGLPDGTVFRIQFICQDGSVPDGLTLSDALRGYTPTKEPL